MFKDQHIVVTGAASGIGRALALDLNRRGAKLSLCDVNEEGLAAVRAELKHPGHSEVFDISDKAGVLAFAEAVQEKAGVPDIVINNAGVALFQSVQQYNEADMRWLFNINFWGVVNCTQAFLPAMLAKNAGTIVNLSSLFGLVGYPANSAYCASKFAVRGYTEAMQIDLAETGVKAVLVHPGGVKTDIAKSARLTVEGSPVNSREELCREFDKVAPTTSEQASQIILQGLERGKPRIVVGKDAKKMHLISRLMPNSYARVYDR